MQKESLKKVKENYCYISEDYNSEINGNCNESEIELPDKSKIKIGKEKFQSCECLFNPKEFGYNCNSLQEQFMETIKLSDMDIREFLFAKIIFNGGFYLKDLNKELIRKLKKFLKIIIKERKEFIFILKLNL